MYVLWEGEDKNITYSAFHLIVAASPKALLHRVVHCIFIVSF